MSGLLLGYLAYFGPGRQPAGVSFKPGLNVICGASETGKSLIVESIDFMLGQKDPVRDIPEREGYDRIRLEIESPDWPYLTLDRSVEGGHFHAYAEALSEGASRSQPRTLRCQHSAARQDTLSFELLGRTGLTSQFLRTNAQGKTRSLSFRDLARLCIVTEEEIQRRGSPFATGQYTSQTAEYAVFKLLITGFDDSTLVSAREVSGRRDQEDGKIELLDQMIEILQSELDEEGADEGELNDQLRRLEVSTAEQNAALSDIQNALDALLQRRAKVARDLRDRKARLSEIDELVARFSLLDRHYQTDLSRLEAIHESGSLFVHLEQKHCPLCGALPGDQHLDTACDGNTVAVVQAAYAEMAKIIRLRRELNDTVDSLQREKGEIEGSLAGFREEYDECDKVLGGIVAPAVANERESYNQLVSTRAEVRIALEKIDRLRLLIEQRAELQGETLETVGDKTVTHTQISTSLLDEFSQTVQRILEEWHFPNASRVFFDESKRDFQIAGKDRGSTGKGLRAITHAACTIGLMEFCREKELPHPGFVVLDSPLLAYWKPEGDEDDLRGTDLDEMFYRYLLGLHQENQVIIIENKHPPQFVVDAGHVTVFTKNPHQGRYGFFPQRD